MATIHDREECPYTRDILAVNPKTDLDTAIMLQEHLAECATCQDASEEHDQRLAELLSSPFIDQMTRRYPTVFS